MSSDIISFKGLAYVVAEKGWVRWASNVAVIVKPPDTLRMDALERISDVAATLYAKDGKGYLEITSKNRKYPLRNSMVMLPGLGEIPLTTNELADLLVGRPSIADGKKEIAEPFRDSFFIRGRNEELEMSSSENLPLVYTRYSSEERKKVIFEASFDDFRISGNRKFPRHIVLRFENPKLFIEIKYKELVNEGAK